MRQTGEVLFFNTERGFGFIKPDEGATNVFVHVSGLVRPLSVLHPGECVEFEVTQTVRGPRADNVVIVSERASGEAE